MKAFRRFRDIAWAILLLARWLPLWFLSLPFPRSRAMSLIYAGNVVFPERMPTAKYIDFDSYVRHCPPSLSMYIETTKCLSLSEITGRTVLDLGSGLGQYTQLFNLSGAHRVIGLEYQACKSRFASDRFTSESVSFITGSAEAIPLPNHSVDIVFSHTVFEHITDIDASLSEIKRVLRHDGIAIVSFNHIHHRGGHHLFPYIQFPWPLGIVNEDALCKHWSQRLATDRESKGMKFYRDSNPITSLSQGGEIHLNRVSEQSFRRCVVLSGLRIERAAPVDVLHEIIPKPIMYSRLLNYIRGTVVYRIRSNPSNGMPIH